MDVAKQRLEEAKKAVEQAAYKRGFSMKPDQIESLAKTSLSLEHSGIGRARTIDAALDLIDQPRFSGLRQFGVKP